MINIKIFTKKGLKYKKGPRLHRHTLTWAHELVDQERIKIYHVSVFFSRKDAAVILCGMWTLWMARNKRRHCELGVPTRVAMQRAKDSLWPMVAACSTSRAKVAAPASISPQRGQRLLPGWWSAMLMLLFMSGIVQKWWGWFTKEGRGRTNDGKVRPYF